MILIFQFQGNMLRVKAAVSFKSGRDLNSCQIQMYCIYQSREWYGLWDVKIMYPKISGWIGFVWHSFLSRTHIVNKHSASCKLHLKTDNWNLKQNETDDI